MAFIKYNVLTQILGLLLSYGFVLASQAISIIGPVTTAKHIPFCLCLCVAALEGIGESGAEIFEACAFSDALEYDQFLNSSRRYISNSIESLKAQHHQI